MSIIKKKTMKTARTKKGVTRNRNKAQTKRQKAIEKAVAFWNAHAVDMSNFKFDREEANAR